MQRRASARSTDSTGPKIPNPALLTSTSIGPAAPTACSTDAGSRTSRASRSATSRSVSVSGRRAVATTSWPRLVSSTAVSRPIPVEHPVISTRLTGPPGRSRRARRHIVRGRCRRHPCASRSVRCRRRSCRSGSRAPRAVRQGCSGAGRRPRQTMFVSIRSGSTQPGNRSASTSARRRARVWSSARRSTIVSSATIPAAAITPACRQAPPSRARSSRAAPRCAAVPQRTEPTGAARPFERQNMSVSTGAHRSRGVSPVARAAFQMRAPSQCTASPCWWAASATAATAAAGQGRPLAGMCGFSIATADRGGRCWPASATARRTALSARHPSGSGTGRSCTPAFRAVAARSYR